LEKNQNESNSPKENSFNKKLVSKKNNFVFWAVFIFAVSIVLINLVSVVFPALIASNNSVINEFRELGIIPLEIDQFTLGVWTVPLIISNFIVFVLAILYFKKKLPKDVTSSIDFIFNFEISKKIASIIIVIFLAIYIGQSVGDLTTEEHWEDYPGVINRVENWSPEQFNIGFEPHVRYFLLWSSMNLFGYFTIIPFIVSILLLLLTYFFTVTITKKRFTGIVSFLILLQSNVFLSYDTTVSYTNFWILFYLLSLYLIYKAWPLSPVSYLVSIFSKSLTAIFLPMSLFFFYRSNIPKRKKIITMASSAAILLAGSLVFVSSDSSTNTAELEGFDSDDFWLGFTSFSYQLRFDGLILLFILPLIVGLFIAARNGVQHADSIMVLISGILLTAPFLTGFTDQTAQPYRFVPVIVFFAVGVGILLSKSKEYAISDTRQSQST